MNPNQSNNAELALKLLLRLIGSSSLLALIFIPFPYSWMDSIHQMLGLGTLPSQPIVGYLARSTSAFYAIIGGLLWLVSFDLKRYRFVIFYMGAIFVLFGISLWFIDTVEGLPNFWRFYEGPIVLLIGVTLLLLNRKVS